MTIRAYAKINLILSVGAPEPVGAAKPGFHRIASWMAPIELHDDVEVSRLPEGSTSEWSASWAEDAPRPTTIDWPMERDLAVRALRVVESRMGRPLPTRINVRKRIPTGGGLGGGSTDAAAAIEGINRVHSLGLSFADLRAAGAEVGSDVAFFLDEERGRGDPPRPALVLGFGERVERVERVSSALVMIVPPYGCSTPDVYREFDACLPEIMARNGILPPKTANESLVRKRAAKALSIGLSDGLLYNDLSVPARRIEPRLAALVTSIERGLRRDAHVTGSGSCVFVLAEESRAESLARKARDVLAASESGGAVVITTRLV